MPSQLQQRSEPEKRFLDRAANFRFEFSQMTHSRFSALRFMLPKLWKLKDVLKEAKRRCALNKR